MADINLNAKVRQNCRTLAEWEQINPVPLKDELVIVEVPSENGGTSQYLSKIGNGVSKFSQLPWMSALAGDVFDWAKTQNKPTYNYSEITGLDDSSVTLHHMHDANSMHEVDDTDGTKINAFHRSLIPSLNGNRFYGLPANDITIEYSNDAGVTYTEYRQINDDYKNNMYKRNLLGTGSPSKRYFLGNKTSSWTVNDTLRVTITPSDRIFSLDNIALALSIYGTIYVDVEYFKKSDSKWYKVREAVKLTASIDDRYCVVCVYDTSSIGPSLGNNSKVRLTFYFKNNSCYAGVNNITGYGQYYSYQKWTGNKEDVTGYMSATNVPYQVNAFNQSVLFKTPVYCNYSGSASDTTLLNKKQVTNLLTSKQDTLVSGTNIKTINGESLLGSGDITINSSTPVVTSATINTVTFFCYDNELSTQDVSGTNIQLKATKNNNILYVNVQFDFDSTWYNSASFNEGTFKFTIPSSVLSSLITDSTTGKCGGNVVVTQPSSNNIQELFYNKVLTQSTYSSMLYIEGTNTSSIVITRDASFPEDTTESYNINIDYTCILNS